MASLKNCPNYQQKDMPWLGRNVCETPNLIKDYCRKFAKNLLPSKNLFPVMHRSQYYGTTFSEKKKLYWWIGIARRQKALKSVSDSGFWVKFNAGWGIDWYVQKLAGWGFS